MDAAPSLHPTDQTLSSYGLGKLDDRSAEAVNEHLMECSDCRKRVAEMSADSFLERVRDARKPSGKPASGQPQAGGTRSDPKTNAPKSPPAEILVTGVVDHPDYEIKRELGQGGMGVVYLAHNKLMGRDEVLKVMGRQIMDRPEVLERFLREIRSVARLRHPNIVTAYSATRLGESIVFAMEYVDGLDLSKMVKAKGPLPVGHACNFVYQAALGLQHAHEEGLVHRDIKPHNLMLAKKGDKATVKVLDFGLARAVREEEVDGGLTTEGQTLGTPDYIAPEQILDAKSADIRADIYSLGGTLYYLLTGRPPFQAKSLYDLYQAHIARDADPLNFVRAEVPSELAALVAKMMAKDPSRRFQTPGEAARALTPFFKQANAPFKIPDTEISLAGQRNASPTIPQAASSATQLETDADGRMPRPTKALEPSVAEPRWEDMVNVRETESSLKAAPEVAPRPWWFGPAVVVGVLLLGFLVAWAAWILWVKTEKGDLVFSNLPEQSVVTVDNKVYTVEWPGGKGPARVTVPAGDHRVRVELNGLEVYGDEVRIETGKKTPITLRLEPLPVPAAAPPPTVASPQPSTPADVRPESHRVPAVVPRPRLASPQPSTGGDSIVTNSIGMKLVLIPAGSFEMGSPDSDKDARVFEKPQHRVRITRPFYLGVHEVTQGQYEEVTGETPSGFKGSDDLPVEQVSWNEAIAFCTKLSARERLMDGYRLPSEAEWEYACRAGSTTRYSFGDDAARLGEFAWYGGNSGNTSHPVGQKRPNAWGLYDMHGNVWEWCSDGYKAEYYKESPPTDPPGASQAADRVNRGGGWRFIPRFCRAADRSSGTPGDRRNGLGFRLARVQSGQ